MTVYLNVVELGRSSAKRESLRKKKRDSGKAERKSIFSGSFLWLSGFTVLVMVGYIITVNMVATSGYGIKATENRIEVLKNENDALKIKISEMQSIDTLEKKALELGMVEPEVIDYVNEGENLALK